jgi:membrane protease YdiL (CAAX protease family)
MNAKSPYRVLIFHFILFLIICIAIWILNIIGLNTFPGNNLFPFLMRSTILLLTVTIAYYLNFNFSKKTQLNFDILKFRSSHIKYYLGGILIGCFLIATIWGIIYLIHPFEIIKNPDSKNNLAIDLISYTLGNTLEELFFRGFILLASVKLFGKIGGVFFVSLLFGLFHLQGTGLTANGLTMVMTTFTMSLLFISLIYYTTSIWVAVTLHITGNFLLHSLGFDGTDNGLFQIKFAASTINGLFFTLIYEIVVIAFAFVIFLKVKKPIKAAADTRWPMHNYNLKK